jgi:hypothetical protein
VLVVEALLVELVLLILVELHPMVVAQGERAVQQERLGTQIKAAVVALVLTMVLGQAVQMAVQVLLLLKFPILIAQHFQVELLKHLVLPVDLQLLPLLQLQQLAKL